MKKISVLLMLLIANFIFSQNATFSDVVNYYNTEKNFNGSVVVATSGKIDYINGIGLSNRQSDITINSKSKFKICSLTKTFTAVMVLQLLEEGKIKLDANIGTYLPDYSGEAKDKVSIENLLTYSSGLPNCESYIGDDIYTKPITRDEFITKYCSGKLEAVPGTKFSYDNGDFVILGKIIEKITGKSFEENLQQRILKPLQMENTEMLSNKNIVAGLVQSYLYDEASKNFGMDKPYYIENFFSAGAMYSTVEDLLKFDQGIFTYKLLKKPTVDLMITPHPNLDNVGLGFWTAEKYGLLNSKFVYRPGGIYGSSANWIHVLDSNRAILVLSNTNATNLFEMSQQLNGVATNQKVTIPAYSKTEAKNNIDTNYLKGTWIIDLRPTPKSEAYYREFLIKSIDSKKFTGEFYGSSFENGMFNTDWGKIYFAFTTADKENIYYHSGFIEGDVISGVSFSADRKFISHWTGHKNQ
ncbi:MAG: beta-lactamase family protein [Chryseobacterium sp.]|nr:beta-lactamase family protein [Chryseobacterium sp.]